MIKRKSFWDNAVKEIKAKAEVHGQERLLQLNQKAFNDTLNEEWKPQWGDQPKVRLKIALEQKNNDGKCKGRMSIEKVDSEDKEIVAKVEAIWKSFISKEVKSRATPETCSNCQRENMTLYNGLCTNFCWNRSEEEMAEEVNRIKRHKDKEWMES